MNTRSHIFPRCDIIFCHDLDPNSSRNEKVIGHLGLFPIPTEPKTVVMLKDRRVGCSLMEFAAELLEDVRKFGRIRRLSGGQRVGNCQASLHGLNALNGE